MLGSSTPGRLTHSTREELWGSTDDGAEPSNPGIVDLEVAVLDVRPEPALNAIKVEIANPTGDGVRILLDLGLTLDFAMRLVGSAMRLRRLIP
jgi:hypothetical protein